METDTAESIPPAEFLNSLAKVGLSVALGDEGESLLLRGPKEARSPEIRTYLRQQKPQMVAHLRKSNHCETSAPEAVPAEPDQDADSYENMIQQAVIAARAGLMDCGERVQIAPGTTTTEPARVLLATVQRAQSLRSRLGENWFRNIDGQIVCSTMEAISLWWHDRQQ